VWYQKDDNTVSYTSKPLAGDTMALRWLLVNLGISRPLLLLLISSMAEGLGEVVPMPIFCAAQKLAKQNSNKAEKIFFMV
jgi:hypothetical protein